MGLNSYRFFSNTDCEYFPCHKGLQGAFNCLFCYCPLYALGEHCGGNFEYLPSGVKSCMNCAIPHSEKGYEYILSKFGEIAALAKRK
ncbi:MAG: cysteine-rich small domain-containing protein [Clostridia bacterium]|nr:cysteine-rich small domain-containing protein [Clostridia bacterium]